MLYQNSLGVGDFEGYLHWINPSSGKLEARVRTGDSMITNRPIVVDDKLYVQTDGGMVIAYRSAPLKRKSVKNP